MACVCGCPEDAAGDSSPAHFLGGLIATAFSPVRSGEGGGGVEGARERGRAPQRVAPIGALSGRIVLSVWLTCHCLHRRCAYIVPPRSYPSTRLWSASTFTRSSAPALARTLQEHVAEGAPLNEADFCGDPPLVLAAGNGHLAVAKFLIDEGADLQQCGMMRDTPLHRAAHNGHLQTVKFLLEEGAEIDALDVSDNTALHWAAMRGHVEIVKELLEQGADKTLTNSEDKLPIDLCQAVWSPAWQFTRAVLED